MEKFIIQGGRPLRGTVSLRGAKNVAIKMFVAALLTDEEIILHNIPDIRDVAMMLEVLKELGVTVTRKDHTVRLKHDHQGKTAVPLDVGARLRTSSLVLGPLLQRFGSATVPNPGGCRLGARPIDRHILALESMGAVIEYNSKDGYFYATAPNRLKGTTIQFEKNTHTGTETVILAAVLARGKTIIENAAQEVEIDDLIKFLVQMGAHIHRPSATIVSIEGVSVLHGGEYTIIPDRNEEATFAIAAALTNGEILVENSERMHLKPFIEQFERAHCIAEPMDKNITRYKRNGSIIPTDIVTSPHPGFMTDWQAPWAVLMTQAQGVSTIHETVFENRFSYVEKLQKMGADISFFTPKVDHPESFYNFNWSEQLAESPQAIRITGPTSLHNAVVDIDDIRAGATLVLAALAAEGESYLYQAEKVDRGYEAIEDRLRALGATIERVKEDSV